MKSYDKKFFRMLYILNLLDRRKGARTADLAKEFGVSLRTVQRDIDLLCQVGFPLVSLRKGQYRFMDGFSLRKVMLSEEESSLLVLLKEISSSLGGRFDKTFATLAAKLIPNTNDLYAFRIGKPIKLERSLPFMPDLEKVITDKTSVKIYYTKNDQLKFHIGDPLRLVLMEGVWYLAFRRHDGKLIKFRLDNINSIEPLGRTFSIDKATQKALDGMSNPWYGSDVEITARLSVAGEVADHFRRRDLFPMQKILKDKGKGAIQIQTTYARAMEVVPTILAWLPHIRVLAPQALKDEVDSRIKKFLFSD